MTVGTTAAVLSDAVQTLIDARLDTLDRMLLGRVPRADRRAIVDEVEAQIFELLQGYDHGALSRGDVLGVLAGLDPPEAYLPDAGSITDDAPPRLGPHRGDLPPPRKTTHDGRLSGVLGLVSLGLLLLTPVVYFLALFLESEAVLLAAGFVVATGMVALSILGLVFAYRSRLRDGWSVCGLVTSILALLIALGTLMAGVFLIIG